MRNLLAKIDAIYMHRPLFTQEPASDRVRSQASGTSAVVQLNPPPEGLVPGNDRSSFASTSATVVEDLHDRSPSQDDDYKVITPTPSNNSRSELANLYRSAYPHLPSQIAPSGQITRPFSASFLPTLSPPLESADRASPGIPPIHPPSSYMRYNDQHRRALVYYPPRGGTASRSATLSSLHSPTRAVPASSTTSFVRSSSGVYSSTPPASPEDDTN
ncbi:hypothetical protein H4582DRAFT_1939960 [Lactarius indigo]|nr:hypothetical protein H4582DRAFT_1939960 [Lactarius indigo]